MWFYDGYQPYEHGEEVEREHLNLFKNNTKKIENTEDIGKSGTLHNFMKLYKPI